MTISRKRQRTISKFISRYRYIISLSIVICLSLFVFTTLAISDDSNILIGNNFPVSTVSSDKWSPSIAHNTQSNQYLTIWEDSRRGFGNEIYGQLLNADGSLAKQEIKITNTDESTNDGDPAVSYNESTDQFLVVWIRSYGPDNEAERLLGIYGVLVNSNGTLASGEMHISDTDAGSRHWPEIAYNNKSNEYLVVWENLVNYNLLYDIYGQRVSSTGGLVNDNFPISASDGDERHPKIAYNKILDKYLVAWDKGDAALENRNVYAQLVDSDGGLQAPQTPITTSSKDDSVDVASADSNGFMIVWRKFFNNADIYGAVLGSDSTLGSHFIISSADGDQFGPVIAFNSMSNKYLVAWDDYRNGPEGFEWRSGNSNIYAQLVNVDSSLDQGEILVSNAPKNQISPAVAYNPILNQFIVAWSHLNSNMKYDLYAQRLLGIYLPAIITQPVAQPQKPANQILSSFLSLSVKPKTIVLSKSTTISGTLRDSAGAPVVGKKISIRTGALKKIKKKIKGKVKAIKKLIWKVIATVTTNVNGQFTLKHKPKKTTSYQASFTGDGSYSASNSNAAKVTVKKAKKKAKKKKKK